MTTIETKAGGQDVIVMLRLKSRSEGSPSC